MIMDIILGYYYHVPSSQIRVMDSTHVRIHADVMAVIFLSKGLLLLYTAIQAAKRLSNGLR